MSIEYRPSRGEWYVVEVSGRLDQVLTPQLDIALSELIDQGHVRLIVDLSAVGYINSGGLRALVAAWRKAHEEEGDIQLAGLSDRVLEIFQMVGFEKIFRIHPNLSTALNTTGSTP